MRLTKTFGSGALALVMVAGLAVWPAWADGLPTRAGAKPAANTSPWTGCHVGASAGAAAVTDADAGFGGDGYSYGAAVGCDVQFGQLVVGAFANHDWGRITAFGSGMNTREWAFGARAGVAVDRVLLYAEVDRAQLHVSGADSDSGIGVGGGIEVMFAPNWSAKVEYRRERFGDLDVIEQSVRAGVAFHFPVPGVTK